MFTAFLKCLVFVVFTTLPLHMAVSANIEPAPNLFSRLSELRPIYTQRFPAIGDDQNGALINSTSRPDILLFSGVIEKGDTEKLQKAMSLGKAYGKVIIFDSAGGSFLEGIKIGQMLQENLSSQDPSVAGAFVLKGQQCLSACALAFSMSSSVRDLDGSVQGNQRYVEKGASLGFHMGLLPKNLLEKQAQVQEIMNLTYDVVAAYTKLIKGNLNPEILLEEALKHRTSDSFFYLTGGVRTYNMGFTPVANTKLVEPVYDYAMSLGSMSSICSSYIMTSPLRKTLVSYDYLFVNGKNDSGDNGGLIDEFNAKNTDNLAGSMASGEVCYVSRGRDRTIMIELKDSGSTRICNQVSANGYNDQAWCASSYQSKQVLTVGILSDTYKCLDDQLIQKFEPWYLDVSNDFEQTSIGDFKKWKRTIARDVNMRSQPSLNGQVVIQLQKDEIVQVTGCKVTGGSQGVWYHVAAGSRKGWVSARFIREVDVMSRPRFE